MKQDIEEIKKDIKQLKMSPVLFNFVSVVQYKEHLIEISFSNSEDSSFNAIMLREDAEVLLKQLKENLEHETTT